jgi:hypothetical protein
MFSAFERFPFCYMMKTMKVSEKVIGMVALIAFTLMAGSVICLASGQANMMNSCGNGMTTGVVCPFMSVSVQAIASTSTVTRVLGFVVALLLVVGFVIKSSFENGHADGFFAMAHERTRDSAVGRRSDVVLNLISDGVLHSRVFGY